MLKFQKGPKPFGHIFALLCNFFIENTYNEELEILLLSVLKFILTQSSTSQFPLQLLTYALQLLKKYFKNLGLRSARSMLLNNQDSGLAVLLFDKDLFYCSSSETDELIELSVKARNNWNKIWTLLCKNPKNYQWLCSAIL